MWHILIGEAIYVKIATIATPTSFSSYMFGIVSSLTSVRVPNQSDYWMTVFILFPDLLQPTHPFKMFNANDATTTTTTIK
ncbi:hypothetical protein BLOT_013598 [Blomia tropicalis]|nr:hypothetical protein BLOT_013598 [Blomia tropicalis]